ncbi:hypothetical protein P153DRAFT_365035 [Dothidotthia symphoricarpi CBS 119687]|uniref:Reverse transcriptase domain-containing protein n=1 Tax=Dothidotthia symphoricarpi CBS 119687 TaxID=1392245 RepID=A0A6A6AI20_9PLEO|nr:uncharacterized protein P153DRAFT_365035 [Dothidotthia symphoricarpi CBS 119687]KAF2131450.1 hypothetical protein P153DRAFT_365035 [Dothidotthia symphoricarpi CBS 119687]
MASSGSVFSETLQTITTTKLEELAKQRAAFDEQYAALLAAAKAENYAVKRLEVLVDGIKACLGVKTVACKANDRRPGPVVSGGTRNVQLETDLKNLDRFLEQARYDPSVSPKVLEDWETTLLQYLSVQDVKFQYADLYGKLVTEWLSSEKSALADGDVEMAESFEELPGTKKLEARAEWEKVVFEPPDVDLPMVRSYLNDLLGIDKKAIAAIKDLHDTIEEFENSLSSPAQFSIPTLRWVITGLADSDLLSSEKREVLNDFLNNDVILAEIADILNLRMAALDRWSWGDHVLLEQRRKLNGGYNFFMHHDLLQAIFLHYIGVKWSVFFKAVFLKMRDNEQTWKSNSSKIGRVDRLRRSYFLGSAGTNTKNNLQGKRNKTHRKRYFVHQLLDHNTQRVELQEGEEEAEYSDMVEMSRKRKQTHQQAGPHPPPRMQKMQAQAPMPAMPAMFGTRHSLMLSNNKAEAGSRILADEDPKEEADDEDEEDDQQSKKPMEAKQHLLHLLSTEIIVNSRLHGELTCFRTIFESWNPLLPHETVLAVLEFFGVSTKWNNFFRTFMQAPLKFMDDDRSSQPRLRRRGTPGSHALSDVFGEAVLFCLDFAVNQATDGALLHRLNDDVWFWSKDHEKCAKAWTSVLKFTEVMGVKINETKTGSVRISPGKDLVVDDRLPQGEIRWGFLYLDPSSGRFEIDQKNVDVHILELRKQLQGKSKSVIDWIQAWNSYAATFFSSNFGASANCFGREHVDKMLATHRHIQESIFDGGNVVQHLKTMIKERFNVANVPDGFLFFPVELGGLDLKSPFVNLLQIRESVMENPYDLLDLYEENERDDYTDAKQRFDSGEIANTRQIVEDPGWKPEDADTFISIDEFTRYREEFTGYRKAKLSSAYVQLLKQPTQRAIDISEQVRQALNQLRGQSNLRGITSHWGTMDAYWKWITQMYGPEMASKFGGLNVVDFGLLPLGMVQQFRQKRIKWQG